MAESWKFDDELDEILSDPGMVNNPEKLTQMRVTQKDLEDLKSTAWLEKADFLKELILQDTSLNDMFRRLHDSELPADPSDPKRVITALLENMKQYHSVCSDIISDMKKKPAYDPTPSKTIFSNEGKEKVQNWIKTLDNFGKTYAEANTLRLSRKSNLPTELSNKDEMIPLLSRLKEIVKELKTLTDAFDSVLETESSKHE